MADNKGLTRRDTLKIATWTIGGLISSALGLPAVAYIIGPALKPSDDQGWIKLGPTTKVEFGVPTLFKAKITRQTGWISSEEQVGVFVLTEDGRDYIAMSNICTHLGCRVRWIQDKERFLSPCHNGIFDKRGMVISGPPPRPLDRYEIKIENGQVHIGKLYWVET
ncbi:MAG TPA: ubiquinol-cytochrome c reductase iron-sulfur subunit [Anaerolineales bacterium]|nr:ubiquinol-cytochrome c reductase iron-sulfur subunit [Anaerolineales bacterium]